LQSEDLRDDIVSVHTALLRRYQEELPSWVLKAGPLPDDEIVRQSSYSVVERGMDELEAYFASQGLPV
jgi:hypothetical protein